MEMSRKLAPLTSRLLIPDKYFRTNGCDCCQLVFAEVNWCRFLSVVVPREVNDRVGIRRFEFQSSEGCPVGFPCR